MSSKNNTFKIHKKEKLYYNWMIVFTILLCIPGLLFLPYVLFIALFVLFSTGIFIGYVKGSGVHVTKDQFSDLYDIVVKQCKILSIKNIPQVYILESGGLLNAMATKFVGSNYLIIYSDLYEVILDGRKDVVEFIIAHELCHIKRNHVHKKMYVFPSLIIPFLALAYSRACEYTCDAAGYSVSPRGAVDGIKLLASGKRLYKEMNADVYSKQLESTGGFWVWFSEKLSTHPHLSKRITTDMKRASFNSHRYADKPRIIEDKNKEISRVEIQSNTSEIEKGEKENKSKGNDHQRFMPKF
ncbi:M48 family metallopeptidase [Aquimarina aquimarini]|uniref:M48 family metallopeptidase n=1 Tax=Aquimarina aquimarini TaxID=1191734 RepID=UPI000D55FFAC|nr:M48 family metallopeptidase [Aquimarina aquimarini]